MNDNLLGPGGSSGNSSDGDGGDGDGGGGEPNLLADWRRHLPDDVAALPAMERFNGKEFSEVVKSYINLEKKLGGNPIVKPGKDATPEQIAEYYTQLGRPEDPAGYELGPIDDMPEGFSYDAEEEQAFRKWAHEQGISADHAQAFWERRVKSAADAFTQTATQRRQAVAEAFQGLRREWGEAYEERLKLANRVARLGGRDFAEFMQSRGLHQEVPIVKLFADLGAKLSEDTLADGQPKPSLKLTPQEAQSNIAMIRGDKDHPFNHPDKANPGRLEALKEMDALYKLAYGDKPYGDGAASIII